MRPYWNPRDELTVLDGIVLKGMRIVVPPSLTPDILAQIHSSHIGVSQCKARAREALYWPGMSQQIEDLVSSCQVCNTYQNKQQTESLRPTLIPEFPWSVIASDLFDWQGETYAVTVDYYSKFLEVDKLMNASSESVIDALKDQICRHSIPEQLRTDNGPQYTSQDFAAFCKSCGIKHTT